MCCECVNVCVKSFVWLRRELARYGAMDLSQEAEDGRERALCNNRRDELIFGGYQKVV